MEEIIDLNLDFDLEIEKDNEIQKLQAEIKELKRKLHNLKQNNKADYVEKWNYEKKRKKEMKEKDPEEYKKLQERRKETNKRYREKQKKILNNIK